MKRYIKSNSQDIETTDSVRNVSNPESPKTLTEKRRRDAETIIRNTMKESGGAYWDGWDGGTTYVYDKGVTSPDKLAQSMSNNLRRQNFETDYESGRQFYITDPKDWTKAIQVTVSIDSYNSAQGKDFYCVSIENIY